MRPIRLLRFALLPSIAMSPMLGCGAPADESVATSDDALSSGQRADKATNAFVDLFFDQGRDDLRETHPSDGAWALPDDYWKYVQSFDAVLDAVERSDGQEFEIHAQQLFQGWHDRPELWRRGWFDDENWVALALLHAHRVMKRPNGDYRALAEATFDDIWARGATHDGSGAFTGIWESIDPGGAFHTKAAVSNFGPAITAARLGEIDKAREIYRWAREHLADASTGEVYDHLARDGSVVDWQYTYTYGVAIGAALQIYRDTQDVQYRDDAYRYADHMVHHLVADWNGRPILHDGCEARCESQSCDCSAFKGIGYRYLAELYASRADAGDPALAGTVAAMHEVLGASAKALWDARSSDTTFPSDWGGGRRAFSSIGGEASAVMTLNIAVADGLLER